MEDTTVFGELISLSEKSYLKSVKFAEGLLNQESVSLIRKPTKLFGRKLILF